MKITLESTNQIIDLQVGAAPHDTHLEARLWEGNTERGIKVQCLIVRIAVPSDADTNLEQFERELSETRAPRPQFQAFPLRMIL